MSNAPSATSSTTSIRRATNLTSEEIDLWELCYYAGVTIDPQVFRILVDLLHMDVHPKAVLDVLKSIAPYSKYAIKEDDVKEKLSKMSISNESKSTSQRLSASQPSNQETISSTKSNPKSVRSSLRSSSIERRSAQSKTGGGAKSSKLSSKQMSEKLKSGVVSKNKATK